VPVARNPKESLREAVNVLVDGAFGLTGTNDLFRLDLVKQPLSLVLRIQKSCNS